MSYKIKMDVPDAIEKATATELEHLHAKFHEKYDSPSSDVVIESHHWLTQGLTKMGIRLPSEPDWEAAIVASQWEIEVNGLDLKEMGLTSDPMVADLVEKHQDFILSEVVSNKSRKLVIKIAESETFTPPAGVIAEGKRALEWIKEGHAGDGFTGVGRARAAQLAGGKAVSLTTLRRMNSYFIRHDKDSEGQGYKPDQKGYPSPGRVAWAAWGGDAGKSWAESIVSRADNAEKSADFDVIKQVDERRFTLGPMYIPDRLDAHGEWTDANELQQAVWDYVKSGDRRIRLQHNKDVVAGEWVEVMTFPYPLTVPMTKADGSAEQVTYPPNTVFLGVQWDDWAWEMVKAGKLRGYSIGGKASRLEADIPQLEEKADGPTVSDVHVDTIMGGKPRRRKN